MRDLDSLTLGHRDAHVAGGDRELAVNLVEDTEQRVEAARELRDPVGQLLSQFGDTTALLDRGLADTAVDLGRGLACLGGDLLLYGAELLVGGKDDLLERTENVGHTIELGRALHIALECDRLGFGHIRLSSARHRGEARRHQGYRVLATSALRIFRSSARRPAFSAFPGLQVAHVPGVTNGVVVYR